MKLFNPDCNYNISRDLSERINIFRFILMIMVIYIHSYGSVSVFSADAVSMESAPWFKDTKYIISQIITRAAVPGFFLISSILLYRKPFTWSENMKKKLRSLAIPYMIVNCAWILLFFILQSISFTAGIFSNADNIVRNWDLRQWSNALFGLPDDSVPFLYPLWFLRDLLILNLFAVIVWKLVDKLPELMFAAALYLWFFRSIPNTAVPDYQAVAFWIFGAYIVRRNIRLDIPDKFPLIFPAALLAVCIYLYMPVAYVDEYLPLLNLCITLSLVSVFVLCSKLQKTGFKAFLLKISSYSFSIYLFHEFTTLLFRKIGATVFPATVISQFLQYMLIPFIVTAFCIVFSIVLKKLMPHFYTLLNGGR